MNPWEDKSYSTYIAAHWIVVQGPKNVEVYLVFFNRQPPLGMKTHLYFTDTTGSDSDHFQPTPTNWECM